MIKHVYEVRCDNCSEKIQFWTERLRTVKFLLKRKGWLLRERGQEQYCHDCRGEFED